MMSKRLMQFATHFQSFSRRRVLVVGSALSSFLLFGASATANSNDEEKSSDGTPPTAEIMQIVEKNIALVKGQAESLLQHEVGFDREAVKWLDDYIIQRREKFQKSSGAAELFGCFYGECVKQVYGGKWLFFDGDLVVRLPVVDIAFVISHVKKHIDNEEGDSILSKFDVIGVLIKDGNENGTKPIRQSQ